MSEWLIDFLINRLEGSCSWRRKHRETSKETGYNCEYILALQCGLVRIAQVVGGPGDASRCEMAACQGEVWVLHQMGIFMLESEERLMSLTCYKCDTRGTGGLFIIRFQSNGLGVGCWATIRQGERTTSGRFIGKSALDSSSLSQSRHLAGCLGAQQKFICLYFSLPVREEAGPWLSKISDKYIEP